MRFIFIHVAAAVLAGFLYSSSAYAQQRFDPVLNTNFSIAPADIAPGFVYLHDNPRLNEETWSYVNRNGAFWWAFGEGTTIEGWRLDFRTPMNELDAWIALTQTFEYVNQGREFDDPSSFDVIPDPRKQLVRIQGAFDKRVELRLVRSDTLAWKTLIDTILKVESGAFALAIRSSSPLHLNHRKMRSSAYADLTTVQTGNLGIPLLHKKVQLIVNSIGKTTLAALRNDLTVWLENLKVTSETPTVPSSLRTGGASLATLSLLYAQIQRDLIPDIRNLKPQLFGLSEFIGDLSELRRAYGTSHSMRYRLTSRGTWQAMSEITLRSIYNAEDHQRWENHNGEFVPVSTTHSLRWTVESGRYVPER